MCIRDRHNEDEDFSRCVRVWNNKITDYYWSFEKHRYLSYKPGENLYSQQIDPKTMEPIVSYIITPDGVHKYQWTATAKSKKSSFGGKIASTSISKNYP